jgi:hypothetical protein
MTPVEQEAVTVIARNKTGMVHIIRWTNLLFAVMGLIKISHTCNCGQKAVTRQEARTCEDPGFKPVPV